MTSAAPEANPEVWAEALKDQLEMQIEDLPTMSVCVNTADWTKRTIHGLREIVKTQGLIIKDQDLMIDRM